MNKRTVAITREQYREIIKTISEGYAGARPNIRVAMALQLEANLGLRIGDILKLCLNDFIKDGDRYCIETVETKTKKRRHFTVPTQIYMFVENYCLKAKIAPNERILPISERTVQSILKMACDYLGYEGISTHSFRKFYATEIYKQDNDIALVQRLLQHSSPAVTQRYIGIEPERIEKAILGHMELL